MADTASFSAAMKTRFIGPIRDGLHRGKVLLFGDPEANPNDFQGIRRSAEGINFVGNDFRIPLKASRNQAVGFRSEGETLPSPGASTYTYLTEPMRYAYGSFNITGQLLKASENDEGAFKRAFQSEMDDTVLSSKLDHNRAAFNDGSGKMATVVTGGNGVTAIVVTSTINFRTGEVVDFVTAGAVVISPAHTVTGVNRGTGTLTISPATVANVTSAHFPVRASSDSTIAVPNNSQNREIQGLGSLISATGTLHGVIPGTYPFWKSTETPTVGPISDTVLRAAVDGVGFEAGTDGAAGDFAIITTRGVRSRYADTLTAVKRFTNAESVKLHGGFTALLFDENPIYTDDQCPIGTMFGVHIPDLFWAEMADWDWMDQDGSVLKAEPRKDRYVAILYKYTQLGLTRRNSHFKLTGITDDVR